MRILQVHYDRSRNSALVALFFLIVIPQNAYSDFSEFFSENEDDLPTFDSGAIFTSASGTGFVLLANSQVDEISTYPVGSLSRFDNAGTQLWSVFMDAGPDRRDRELIADQNDTSKFFAGFVEDGISARVGLFNGNDLSSIFAYQIPMVAVTQANVGLNYFPGMLSSVHQNLGSSIQLLILDSSGTRVFEKTYASPEFLATEIPFLSTQTVTVSQISDQSGFYISVLRSDLDFSAFIYENKYFLINIDNAGTPRWSKTFELNTNLPPTDTSSPGPGNSYIYRITNVDQSSGVTITNLIKFSGSGELEFAESIEDIRISSQLPNQGETAVYFSGTLTDPNSLATSDFVAVKINPTTGAIEAQVAIDQAALDIGFISDEANGSLFGTLIFSDDPLFEDTTSTVFRFDSNLANPLAFVYSGNDFGGILTVRGDDELLFSTFDGSTGSIGAFTLDASLNPALPGCEDFTEVALNTFIPELEAVDLNLSPSDLAITVGDEISELIATTLPVQILELAVESCVVGGELSITNQPADQTVTVGANASFSVTAQGDAPITYQWKKDGVDVAGATSSALQISDAQESDEGNYTVLVTDANGSLLSAAASLSVNTALAITQQPEDQTTTVGGSVALSVTATGTGDITYQWKKDDVELVGEVSNELMLTDVSQSDVGDYTVVVTSGEESLTSNAATVSISTTQNEGFSAYLASLGVPENMRGFKDDPDNDDVYSLIEYLMGTDANSSASSPEIISSILMMEGVEYLAISYPRDTSITDLSLMAEFSDTLNFGTNHDSVEVSVVDQGDGIERVTQRSAVPIGDGSQFARVSGGG